MNQKVTKVFSGPLMRQSLRSNRVLMIVCILIMCMMSIVISYAGSLMESITEAQDYTDEQSDFYGYLYVMASYNEMAGTDLSYEDFESSRNHSDYEDAFDLMTAQTGNEYSVDDFQDLVDTLSESDIALETYVSQFEYVYALNGLEGVFSGEELDIEGMMNTMLEMMGMDSEMLEGMSDMDTSAMLNQMYYTIMILLPILLFIIVAGNSLVAEQVDKGSMAYILSTPTKRRAVAITQMIYMIIVPLIMIGVACVVRMLALRGFTGSVDVQQTLALYGGLYVLTEAMTGVCYLSSCLFNLSKYSMFLGCGVNVWCFLASLLGMFGSDMMVDMGVGVEALGVFNRLTLVGLFDTDALGTVGSGAVDNSFVWKLIVLAVIAAGCYIVGAARFRRKDLPL